MAMHLNPTSGVPLYLQLIEQIKLGIETGVIRAGEQLPSVRKMAEDLVINPNTVARAYRELEQERVIELRHGAGAFVAEGIIPRAKLMSQAQTVIQTALDRLSAWNLTEDEIRRLVESDFARRRMAKPSKKKYA